MIQLYLKILTLSVFLMYSFNVLSDEINNVLPPILDYYPNCSYQIIKNSTVKANTRTPQSIIINKRLLNRLQSKAKYVGADALILVDKKVEILPSTKRTNAGENYYEYEIRYDAELIKQCKETDTKNHKRTAYNKQGTEVRIIETYNSVVRTKSSEVA